MAQLSLKKTIAKLLDNKAMIDRFYPVGSYYETSDASFNPNTAWGGTWVQETEGLVHIGSGTNYTVGATGGEKTHKLVKEELPSTQYRVGQNMSSVGASGTWYLTYQTVSARGSQASAALQSSATGAWAYTEPLGSNTPHNNMQPYIVVNRWHRTA